MQKKFEQKSNETTEAGIPFYVFSKERSKSRGIFKDHFKLPIINSHHFLVTDLKDEFNSVLDVGATDRRWKKRIEKRWPGIHYFSCDLDQTNYHNYYSWEQIDREFDLVLCIEILEHLSAEKAFELVKLSSSICKPGGYILFTVPNVYTPGIQLEFTHQTAYGINDIGGLCLLSGLNIISGARIFTKSARHQIVHKYFFYWLHRLLRIDFCQSIALLLRKPELNKKL